MPVLRAFEIVAGVSIAITAAYALSIRFLWRRGKSLQEPQ